MAKRKRKVRSVATELVKKAREAMLTAVQIYNNPQINFKSELFIVTTVVAWTYLMHAHYRKAKVEYRQIDPTVRSPPSPPSALRLDSPFRSLTMYST
jgi:hypothetical protein